MAASCNRCRRSRRLRRQQQGGWMLREDHSSSRHAAAHLPLPVPTDLLESALRRISVVDTRTFRADNRARWRLRRRNSSPPRRLHTRALTTQFICMFSEPVLLGRLLRTRCGGGEVRDKIRTSQRSALCARNSQNGILKINCKLVDTRTIRRR